MPAVLYVEDHPVNALLMRALFERRPDLTLVVAETGQQAMLAAAGLDPVLLLLDMRLPDCTGSSLLPRLRGVKGCEQAPAVAVTAEHDFVVQGSGFAELWAKPMDLRQVLQRLDALTGATAVCGMVLPDAHSLPAVRDTPTPWHTNH